MKLKQILKNRHLMFFQKEIIPPFFFNVIAIVALSLFLGIWLVFSWKYRTSALIALETLIFIVASICIYNQYKVYIGNLASLDFEMRKRQEFLPDDVFARTSSSKNYITSILDEFNIATSRKNANLLLQKQAQFDAMQSQIDPHFLYNTIDSIRGKAITEGSLGTADMLEQLAALFRYSISASGDFVTIEHDLQNIESFMKLQECRFPNKFILAKDIEEDDGTGRPVLQYKIPKLILQPIIENAINHGFAQTCAGGIITIKVVKTQTRIDISVIDDGSGIDAATLRELNNSFLKAEYSVKAATPHETHGIALKNVNARLKFTFGNSYGLFAYSTPGIGTEIVVSLPLVETEYDRKA